MGILNIAQNNVVNDATLAPNFEIDVGGNFIGSNIAQFVNKIEYESTDNMMDVGKLFLQNPNNLISNLKAFQPGNEMSMYFGYGKDVALKHVGRVKIKKVIPNYPENGTPTLQVVGYTRDTDMSENIQKKKKKKKGKRSKPRVYFDLSYSGMVEDKAERYNMEADVDATVGRVSRAQFTNMTDYQFVQGIANINGYVFWVDGDENGVWTLHFKKPENSLIQDKKYNFTYNDGDLSTLLSFRPEKLITDSKTNIEVVFKDKKTGRLIEVEVEEENDKSPDLDGSYDPIGTLDEQHTTGTDIKLFFNDFAFEVISNKRFETEAEAIRWTQQWFRRQRENFILASGSTIGIENLKARQQHFIDNVSPGDDGEYYFSKVKHVLTPQSGYRCNFSARKVMP